MPQVATPLYYVPRGDFLHFPSQKAAFPPELYGQMVARVCCWPVRKVKFFQNNNFLEGVGVRKTTFCHLSN